MEWNGRIYQVPINIFRHTNNADLYAEKTFMRRKVTGWLLVRYLLPIYSTMRLRRNQGEDENMFCKDTICHTTSEESQGSDY